MFIIWNRYICIFSNTYLHNFTFSLSNKDLYCLKNASNYIPLPILHPPYHMVCPLDKSTALVWMNACVAMMQFQHNVLCMQHETVIRIWFYHVKSCFSWSLNSFFYFQLLCNAVHLILLTFLLHFNAHFANVTDT